VVGGGGGAHRKVNMERYRSGRNGGASKASCRVTGTGVRIPPSPPTFARATCERASVGKPAARGTCERASVGKPAPRATCERASVGKPAARATCERASVGKPAPRGTCERASVGKPAPRGTCERASVGKPASSPPACACNPSPGNPASRRDEPVLTGSLFVQRLEPSAPNLHHFRYHQEVNQCPRT
jgi:hypothetical protein